MGAFSPLWRFQPPTHPEGSGGRSTWFKIDTILVMVLRRSTSSARSIVHLQYLQRLVSKMPTRLPGSARMGKTRQYNRASPAVFSMMVFPCIKSVNHDYQVLGKMCGSFATAFSIKGWRSCKLNRAMLLTPGTTASHRINRYLPLIKSMTDNPALFALLLRGRRVPQTILQNSND